MKWNKLQTCLVLLLNLNLIILTLGCGKSGLKNKIYHESERIEKKVAELDKRLVEKEFGGVGEAMLHDFILDTRADILARQERIEMRIARLPKHMRPEMEKYYRLHFDRLYDRLVETYPEAMYELKLE